MQALFHTDDRAKLDAELRDVYATMFITSSPAPVKAALGLLGHRVGGLRLPLVECDEGELTAVRDCLARHGLLTKATA
jgi:4-hydroxy-tetrahydrodipicolinate synthase